jgi:hypothetical protein
MNKHHLAGIWHRWQNVSVIMLLIAILISGAISIYALRANNVRMLELKAAVYAADEQGADVAAPLNELREFVYAHMNTDLRAGSTSSEAPIQLVNTFNRVVQAEQARIATLTQANAVYQTAQQQCEQARLPLPERAQCIQDYVVNYGQGVPQLQLPPKELYTFDFVSPVWSPDLAGWSLVVTGILLVVLVVRLLGGYVLKLYLK